MNHSKLCLPEILLQNMASMGWTTLLPAQEELLAKLMGTVPFHFYAHGGSGKRSGLCMGLAAMFCEADKETPLVRGRRPRALILSEDADTSAMLYECFERLVLGTHLTVMRCGAGRDYGERRRVPLGVDLLIGPADALIRQVIEKPQWYDDVKEIFFVDTEKLYEVPEGEQRIEAAKVLLEQIAHTHQTPPRCNFLFNHWSAKYDKFVKSLSPNSKKTRLGARFKTPALLERFTLMPKSLKIGTLANEIRTMPAGHRALVCGDRRRVTTLRDWIRAEGIKAELVEDAKPEDNVIVAASLYCDQLAGQTFDRVLLYRAPESPEVYETIASLAVFPATSSRPWYGELVMLISVDQIEEFCAMSEQLAFGKWRYTLSEPRPRGYKDYLDLIERERHVNMRRTLCEARVKEDLAREAALTQAGSVEVVAPAIQPAAIPAIDPVPVQPSLFAEIEDSATNTTPTVPVEAAPAQEALAETSSEVTSDAVDAANTGDTLAEEVVERIEETVAEEAPEVTDEDEVQAAETPVDETVTEDTEEEEETVLREAVEAAESAETSEAPENQEAREDEASSIESDEDAESSETTEDDVYDEEEASDDAESDEASDDADETDEDDAFDGAEEDEEDYDDDWEEVPADDVDAFEDVEEEPHELDYDESEYTQDSGDASSEETHAESGEEATPHRRTLTIRSDYVPRQEYATTVTITEPLSSSTVELRSSQERMRRAMRGSEKLTHQMVGKRGTVRRPRRGAEAPMAEAEGILAAKPGARLPGEKRKGQKSQKNQKNLKTPGMYGVEGQKLDRADRGNRADGSKRQRPKNKPPRQPVVDYATSEALTVPGLVAMPVGLPMDDGEERLERSNRLGRPERLERPERTERSDRSNKNRQDRARNRRNDNRNDAKSDEGQGRSNKKRWSDRRNNRRQQQRENATVDGAQTNDLAMTQTAPEGLSSVPAVPSVAMDGSLPTSQPVQAAPVAAPVMSETSSGVANEAAEGASTAPTVPTAPTDAATSTEGAEGDGKKKFKPRRNNRNQKWSKDGEGNGRRDRRQGKKNSRQRIPSPLGEDDRLPMGAPGDFPRWSDADDDNFGNSINFKPSAKSRKSANPWQTAGAYDIDRPQTLTFAQTMPMEDRREGLSTSFLGNAARPNHPNRANRPNRSDRPDRPEGERRPNDGRKRFNNKKRTGFKNRKGPRNPNGQNGQTGSGDSGANSGPAAGTPE